MSRRPISSRTLGFSPAGMQTAQSSPASMQTASVPDVAETSPSRAVILAVRPEVDGGRYPVKRVVGERVDVEADIVADGHDVLRAVLLHRPPGAQEWEEIELAAA